MFFGLSYRLKTWPRRHWGWFNPSTRWCSICERYERPHEHYDFITPLLPTLRELESIVAEVAQAIVATGSAFVELARSWDEAPKKEDS